MRNENLDLAAQSSGSESSPSWASTNATPRATTTFTFDFSNTGSGGGGGHGQSRATVDELTHQFKKTLRSSRSSEALSENCETTSTTTASSSSSSSTKHLIPSSGSSHHSRKKISYKFGGSGEQIQRDSISGDGGGGGGGGSSSCGSSIGGGGSSGDDKKATKESKIARFLRRTQSAHDDNYGVVGPPPKSSAEVSRETHLEKIDDTEEEAQIRKRIKIGTDMKFRLGFLKRRHTEGTIQASSVRPQPEEAQKWANSFSDLMASKYGQALFKAFLQREFSEENIEFWLAVEDYRKSRQNKLNSKAQKIFNEFVTPQAPKEVNLDALTREGLVSKMAQPTHTTFDQAQKRVQGLLEADAYSRFLKSELYMELIHPEKYPSQQNS